jgi:hypothetical protein
MSTIGLTPLLSSCFLPTPLAAVPLSTITGSANIERRPAPADFLAKNDFGDHPVAQKLDNGPPVMSGWKRLIVVVALYRCHCPPPVVRATGGFSL